MSCTLSLSNINYSIGERVLIENLELSIAHKEKIAIIGPNGCGKSTIMRIISGLTTPQSGIIKLFGNSIKSKAEIKKARQKIGYLFQDCDDQFIAPTVLEDVAFSLLATGVKKDIAIAKSLQMLRLFEVEHLKDRFVLHLSGGEKKIVALAGIMVMEPDLLLLDEPTSALDELMQKKIAEHLKEIDKSMIIVSHQIDFIDGIANSIYRMENSHLVQQ